MSRAATAKAEPATVLVVDDQQDVRTALELLLGDEGYRVLLAATPAEAVAYISDESPALILFDMNYDRDTTSGSEGLALLQQLQQHDPSMPAVAMTAWGSVDLAVRALQGGAVDFVEKPWENNRLLMIVQTQIERAAAIRRADRLHRVAALERADRVPDGIIAQADAMLQVLDMARRVAPSDATVLITGENGVGKGLLAEQIHRWSAVADQVLVSVNMGSIPESLFEAEMFGHARGAFTDAREARAGRFELADGGTLFLDEVGNLPPAQQAKLLRVLETGQFERVGENRTRTARVRVIAATNADLLEMVERGSFRRDLYFRLNTIEIRIPGLRERRADIRPLAERMLARSNRKYGRDLVYSAEAMQALEQHGWPGNVRELAHAVERAVLLTRGPSIDPEHLMLQAPRSRAQADAGSIRTLEELERDAIRRALDELGGDVQAAADALGLSRSAMYRRLERHGLKSGEDGGVC